MTYRWLAAQSIWMVFIGWTSNQLNARLFLDGAGIRVSGQNFLEQRPIGRLALRWGDAWLLVKTMGRNQSRSFAKGVGAVAAPSVVAGGGYLSCI